MKQERSVQTNEEEDFYDIRIGALVCIWIGAVLTSHIIKNFVLHIFFIFFDLYLTRKVPLRLKTEGVLAALAALAIYTAEKLNDLIKARGLVAWTDGTPHRAEVPVRACPRELPAWHDCGPAVSTSQLTP